jgi:surface protein
MNKNFSERINRLFGSASKSANKISDIHKVTNGKIICKSRKKVREVVDDIVKLNDYSVEVVCDFNNASSLFEFKDYKDLSKLKLNTSKVTNMDSMFDCCYNLKSIPQLDTSNVTNMHFMFNKCKSLISIPKLDTSKVTNMDFMFIGCKSLKSIPKLDTSNITKIRDPFSGCRTLDISDYPIDNPRKMIEILSTTGINGHYKESE